MEKTTPTSTYECKICKDSGWIYAEETNTFRQCKCREKKLYKKMIKNSGISEKFLKLRLNDYKTYDEKTKLAKSLAVMYCTEFEKIINNRNNSIAFLGNPGAGKTHLSIAIANYLMSKNIGVLYMSYRDSMAKFAQCRFDESNYQREINKYKNAKVLLIDDLFKGMDRKRNEFEINTMFEIINHRYLGGKPMIISSEATKDKLLDYDEAVGSRIIEMCRGQMIQFVGNEFNYRLKE